MRVVFFRVLVCLVLGLLCVPANAQFQGRSDSLFEPWNAGRRGVGAAPGGLAAPGLPERMQPQSRRGGPAQPEFFEPMTRPQRAMGRPGLRVVVPYPTREAPGTIVIDTPNTALYLVLGNEQAIRYEIGVGRQGFTWAGRERISRKTEWPDWRPPDDMIARDPNLPRYMPGGLNNPLGARALYLGNTLYRIHGTNQPSSIGTFKSSGCFRMLNEDVIDLYERVSIGAPVVVLDHRGFATR